MQLQLKIKYKKFRIIGIPLVRNIPGELMELRDLSEISRGGGVWKQREGHNFLRLQKREGHEKLAVKRGRVVQICVRDHVLRFTHRRKKKFFIL